MIKRTVEIASKTHLRVRHHQLRVERQGSLAGSIPVEDIGVLVLAHPGISLSLRALNELQENNSLVLLCDRRYMPQSALLPLEGHSLHARILREQIQWRKPMRKRATQIIIRSKIMAQYYLLAALGKNDMTLKALAEGVRSGDPDNKEARAAARYWPRLFGRTFRRNPKAGGKNTFLNYGYGILRTAIGRAICMGGLHPALGLFHKNQYNAFALADDLMEPFRPMVDQIAEALPQTSGAELTRDTRIPFLNLLKEDVILGKRSYPLMVAFQRYVASLRAMGLGECQKLEVPHYDFRRLSNRVAVGDV